MSSSETAHDVTTELVHYPNVDIVINRSAQVADYADQLTERFSEGKLPNNWEGFGLNHAYGEVDGKQFFAKVKNTSGKYNFDDLVDLRHRQAAESGWSLEGLKSALGILRASNSILHEIRMSGVVGSLVADEAAQNIAINSGFNGMRFAEPIIGVADKQTGRKIMVYERIEGKSYQEIAKQLNMSDEARAKIPDQLKKLFAENGIEANDLDCRQLIVDNDNFLVLTDTEQYMHSA